jgi:pimeloyl-ACP methyl ester carboxylesterase
MKKRYLIALTGVLSFGLAMVLPTVQRRAATSHIWRLAESAAALPAKPVVPTFAQADRVIGRNFGKRVYLFHGLPGLDGYWQSPDRQALVDALQEDGSQVVVVRLPRARQAFYADGGAAYCQAFSTWFSAFERSISQRYGAAEEYTVGISYGGYHAMLAAQDPTVDGWAAISPVTDLSRLDEFRWQSNSRCQPGTPSIAAKPGLMVYGRHDKRVGSDLLVAAAGRIEGGGNQRFEAADFDAKGHGLSAEMVAKVEQWYGLQQPVS